MMGIRSNNQAAVLPFIFQTGFGELGRYDLCRDDLTKTQYPIECFRRQFADKADAFAEIF